MDYDSLYARYVATCVGWQYDDGIRVASEDDLSSQIIDWLEGLVEDGEFLEDQEQILCFTPDEIKFLCDKLSIDDR